jgi:hypothetical protein
MGLAGGDAGSEHCDQPVSASGVRGTRCVGSQNRVARDFSVSRFSRSLPLIQPTTVIFRFHEPEALADFLHIERTRLAWILHTLEVDRFFVLGYVGESKFW